MKRLTLMTAICAPFACPVIAGAEPIDIDDRMAIIDTITNIAAGADRHQWSRVRGAFADQVMLDYTSLGRASDKPERRRDRRPMVGLPAGLRPDAASRHQSRDRRGRR